MLNYFLERSQIKISDITQLNYHKGWICARSITEFYKEMQIWFREAIPMNIAENGKAVRKQIVWFNKEVCIDRKVVCYSALYNHDLQIMMILLTTAVNS